MSFCGGPLDETVTLPEGPKDTVSALRWSPAVDYLAASSWDGQVYIYDLANSTSTASIKGVTSFPIGAPILDCDFSAVRSI